MILAHGTTEKNADIIESKEYFDNHTYFLKLEPDFKHGIFGTTGFAIRDHPKTSEYVDLYCRQDLIIKPFKKALEKTAQRYIDSKGNDDTPGLIYIVDIDESKLDYHKGFFRNLMLPTELFSTENIPTSKIKEIVTLEENVKHFHYKYGYDTTPLEQFQLDSLTRRITNTTFNRFSRLILGRK
ncbi:MAG: hypothetical protein KKA79_01655 [Nanoarchaeota archaeon]|nr:hypothetical protein [Nanoarchaeota archaeon]MCG2718449.1 hypothetical protein [Nanoarchaeota archaeon]